MDHLKSAIAGARSPAVRSSPVLQDLFPNRDCKTPSCDYTVVSRAQERVFPTLSRELTSIVPKFAVSDG